MDYGEGQIDPGAPLPEKLRYAMEQAGVTSNRRLAILLAGSRDPQAIESARGVVKRLLRGGQRTVHQATAERLAEVLHTPLDFWPTARTGTPSNATALAEELLRRIDGGEEVPSELVLQAAAAVERAAQQALRLAEALRLRARDGQQAH